MRVSVPWPVVAIALLLAGCQRTLSQDPKLPPLPQDANIQVYFNQSQANTYQEPYRNLRRSGDNLEAIALEAIESATTTVDIAVQELRVPEIATALVKRHQAGVKVRVIVENNYRQAIGQMVDQASGMEERDRLRFQDNFNFIDHDRNGQLSAQEIEQRDAIAILEAAGIPILDDTADGSKGSGLMHHKFVVVDNSLLVTGSANFTFSDLHGDFQNPQSRGNPNHLLRIYSGDLARTFTEEFERMWGDGPGGQSDSQFGVQDLRKYRQSEREFIALSVGNSQVQVRFSPTPASKAWQHSGTDFINQALGRSLSTVDLALFVFSEQRIADALARQHQQGVGIRALISSEFAFRSYSEALDLLGVSLPSATCKLEPGNRPWTNPLNTVGVPQLPEGDLLHHKFAVIDRHTVITGSHNWSKAADHQNNEVLLAIDNATVAAHFQREFDRLYKTAVLGVPVHLQERLKAEQNRCS